MRLGPAPRCDRPGLRRVPEVHLRQLRRRRSQPRPGRRSLGLVPADDALAIEPGPGNPYAHVLVAIPRRRSPHPRLTRNSKIPGWQPLTRTTASNIAADAPVHRPAPSPDTRMMATTGSAVLVKIRRADEPIPAVVHPPSEKQRTGAADTPPHRGRTGRRRADRRYEGRRHRWRAGCRRRDGTLRSALHRDARPSPAWTSDIGPRTTAFRLRFLSS